MFLISVFKFVNEKFDRMPGDGVLMAAASSPTDCGAGTGSMIGSGFESVDVNNTVQTVTTHNPTPRQTDPLNWLECAGTMG